MRIGIDARLNGYRQGGISEYTRCLIEALAPLDPTNQYHILHAARHIPPANLLPGPNFRRINVYTPAHHRFEQLALSVEVMRLGLDVLHSPDFIPPRFGSRHTVITVHDLNFLHFPQFQTPDSLRYYAGNIRAAVHRASHILAVSQATANDLGNLLSVPAEKITIQPEGVNPEFHPLPDNEVQAVRHRLELPSNYLLFVGTVEPRKNVMGLLEAYHALLDKLPDAPPLVIAGRKGWLYEPIYARAAELNLGKWLQWVENVTPADLPAVYNGAVALVLPSFYEGFGLPPLEAMACGVPTIVSDRGSLPEVVGDTGLLIDPDSRDSICEGLHHLLTDESLRERSRRDGLARAKIFTWQRSAEVALSVYRMISGC
jgi:glycosyltransferase involved in cell wall biosynthesis